MSYTSSCAGTLGYGNNSSQCVSTCSADSEFPQGNYVLKLEGNNTMMCAVFSQSGVFSASSTSCDGTDYNNTILYKDNKIWDPTSTYCLVYGSGTSYTTSTTESQCTSFTLKGSSADVASGSGNASVLFADGSCLSAQYSGSSLVTSTCPTLPNQTITAYNYGPGC